MTLAKLAFILGAYLLGSIPQLYLLGRLKGKRLSGDLHHELWRQCGRPFGVIGFLSELVKGALPVFIGKAFHLDIAVIAAAGVAGVAGQMWSVFYHLTGKRATVWAQPWRWR